MDLVSALQSKGMALAIFEDSELTEEVGERPECGIQNVKIDVSEGVVVSIIFWSILLENFLFDIFSR